MVAHDQDRAANKKKMFPDFTISIVSISQKRTNNKTPANPRINPRTSFGYNFFLNNNKPNKNVIIGLVVGTITPPRLAIPTCVPLR